MKLVIVLITVTLFSILSSWSNSYGQLTPIIAQTNGTSTQDIMGDLAVDSYGSVYYTTLVGSSYGTLKKIDSAGNLVWETNIGGGGSYGSLTVDSTGNVYVICGISNPTDLDPSPTNTYILDAAFTSAAVVLKLDANHNFIWARLFDLPGGYADFRNIELNYAQDQVIIEGYLSYNIDFDPGPGVVNLTSNGSPDGFLLKLDKNGNFVNVHRIGGSADEDYINDFAVMSDNSIIYTGVFSGLVDMDPGAGYFPVTSVYSHDAYINKIDSNGNLIWSRQIGQVASEWGSAVCVGGSNDIYWIGYYFFGSTDIDPGPSVYSSNTANGQHVFVVKLDSIGNTHWIKYFENIGDGPNSNRIPSDVDDFGYLYFSDMYMVPADFDPGPGFDSLTPHGNGDGYLCKLNPNGNLVWAYTIGGAGTTWIEELEIGPNNLVCLGGNFTLDCDLDPSPANTNVNSAGGNDVFVTTFQQDICAGMSINIDSIIDISCTYPGESYVSANGIIGPYNYQWMTSPPIYTSNALFQNPGVYQVTVTDSINCSRSRFIYINGPIDPGYDFDPQLIATNFRPGLASLIKIESRNLGCSATPSTVKLVLDPNITTASVNPTPSQTNGDTLIWQVQTTNFDSVAFIAHIWANTSTLVQLGDTLHFQLSATPTSLDFTPANNSKNYQFVAVSSYDPNDKSVYPSGECQANYVLTGTSLTYTVRFQNTGTADAINIQIIDSIDSNLDISTFRVISASHNYLAELQSGNKIIFHFNNIHLPDSNSNELLSHGYIVFTISPFQNISTNTSINNSASIIFDYNAPVITNSTNNTFVDSIPNSTNTMSITGCNSVTHNGVTYFTTGTYYQTLSNYLGCDSTLWLNITIHDSSSNHILQESCNAISLNNIVYETSGIYTQILSNQWGCDSLIILDFHRLDSSTNTINIQSCDSALINGISYYNSGTYYQHLINQVGCDSLLTISLTIHTIEPQITTVDTTIISIQNGDSYQWVDCDNNYDIIPGETYATFTPTSNGNYALIMSDQGCIDTSECLSIYTFSNPTISSGNSEFRVSPNPTKGNIIVHAMFTNDFSYSIYSIDGNLVELGNSTSKLHKIDILDIPPGLYILNISDGKSVYTFRIVKM